MNWPNGKVNLAVNWKLYSQGRLVFEQDDAPSFDLPFGGGDSGKRTLIYEDKTPVELGRYQLTAEMKNGDTGATYQASKEF